jgi:hypothetical protein
MVIRCSEYKNDCSGVASESIGQGDEYE